MTDVLAVGAWANNAELIAHVAKLNYIKGRVVDVTYGRGVFWREWKPKRLIKHDLFTLDGVDFRHLPERTNSVDTVVFDPPYRLNGTPDRDDFDDRYGIARSQTWLWRHALIKEGIEEAERVLKLNGHLLLKCQDQVCSGHVRWQTREFSDHAESIGFRLVDRFDFVTKLRKQPPGRRQVHARRNQSTLLVLKKTLWRNT